VHNLHVLVAVCWKCLNKITPSPTQWHFNRCLFVCVTTWVLWHCWLGDKKGVRPVKRILPHQFPNILLWRLSGICLAWIDLQKTGSIHEGRKRWSVIRRSVSDQPLLFIKQIVRTIVINTSVNLRPTCSCRTVNHKSTSSRCHWDNYANYCRCTEALLSINFKAACLPVSSLTSLQTSS